MVSRGNFDELIKQEQRRTVGSQRNADGGENARDRVARRLNQQEGRSKFKSSSAYKPSADKPAGGAKSKSAGGGKRPAPSSPGGGGPSLPKSAPVPSAAPGGSPTLPVATPENPLTYLLPLLISSIAGRGGINAMGAGAGTPGSPGNAAAMGGDFPPLAPFMPPGALAGGAEVPTGSVPLSRVPNAPDPSSMLPSPSVNPQTALPPADPSALSDSNVGRFFDQGEISNMASKMPGITKAPGMGSRAPLPEFNPKIHVKGYMK